MARIRVRQLDGPARELDASPARSLLNNLLLAAVPLRHDCGGKALCGTCRVRVLSGGEHLSRVEEREATRLAALGAEQGDRLACQTRAVRDAELLVLDDGRSRRAEVEAS